MLVGDWVKIKGQEGKKDRIGYILEVDSFYNKFIIIQTVPKIEFEVAKLTLYRGSFVPLDVEEIKEMELNDLIDISLRRRDKVWFMELTSKLKQINKK